MSKRYNKPGDQFHFDAQAIDKCSDDIVNLLMPKILRRLDAVLPGYICEQVLKHIDYPMDIKQAAYLLEMSEGALRKWEMRGGVTFTKTPKGRKMITLQSLCKQVGNSVVLQHIKNRH